MNIDGNENKAKVLLLEANNLLFQAKSLSAPLSREHYLATSMMAFLESEQAAGIHKTWGAPDPVTGDRLNAVITPEQAMKLELLRIVARTGATELEIKEAVKPLFEWLQETGFSLPCSPVGLGSREIVMFVIDDVEQKFDKPNTALRVEITAVRKRPPCVEHNDEITEDMAKYALEQALEMLTCKVKCGDVG